MVRRSVILAAVLAIACAGQPRRIISTAPSITEMLYAVGVGDRVVGVTTYCHYPPDARTKEKIGTYIEPNLEKITSLRPDLVVIQKNPIQLGAKLEGLHLKVLEVRHDSVDEVFQSIEQIGSAAGTAAKARELTARLRSELEAVRRQNAGRHVRMMFVVGRAPGRLEDIIAVGRASYLNGLIEMAGGDNIFKDAAAPYPKVGMEEILSRNPQVIVDMGDMSDTEGVSEAQKRSVIALWSTSPAIAAVKSRRVYAVASDIFTVPGPRMVEAARAFAEMLRK